MTFKMPCDQSKKLDTLKVYGIPVAFILGWWALALHEPSPLLKASDDPHHSSFHPISDSFVPALLNKYEEERGRLHRALSGDFLLMGQMIAEWDAEARVLSSKKGFERIQRLSDQAFIRSQVLAQLFKDPLQNHSEVQASNSQSYLPQTYTAAAFLLAIAPAAEIVALPENLRQQTQIYPSETTSKIPLDINRFNAEKLFIAHPAYAFAARYSHPTTLQAISNQGIALHIMKDIKTLDDMTDELLSVGRLAHRHQEAELLTIFIDASILAIGNNFHFLTGRILEKQGRLPKILFLNYYHTFSIPTIKTLMGNLLTRLPEWDKTLKIALSADKDDALSLQLSKEQLAALNPECLIISAQNPSQLEKYMRQDALLSQLTSVKNDDFYFIDEAVQQSASQYIVLAYYDLLNAIKKFSLHVKL